MRTAKTPRWLALGSLCALGLQQTLPRKIVAPERPSFLLVESKQVVRSEYYATDPDNNSYFECTPNWESKAGQKIRELNGTTAAIDLGGSKFLPAIVKDVQNVSAIEVAVIRIHGVHRAMEDWPALERVARMLGKDDSTVSILPVFGHTECQAADYLGDENATGSSPAWGIDWKFGIKSVDTRMSSFQALDKVIHHTEATYPRLKRIVVTSFSAGAMFIQRWAVLSPEGVNGRTSNGTELRITFGSPSDYLYLDDSRPSKHCMKCNHLWCHSTKLSRTCETFLKPHEHDHDVYNNCSGEWDKYPYGLSCLEDMAAEPGSNCSDVGDYAQTNLEYKKGQFPEALRQRFATKDISFSAGELDDHPCQAARWKCSDGCGDMVQGASRLNRAVIFGQHLKHIIPGYKPNFHVFDASHVADSYFASDAFATSLFDMKYSDFCDYKNTSSPRMIWNMYCPGQ